MEKVDTLIVDKTGTLTEGRPRVVHVEAASGFTADQIVQKLAQRRARQRAPARRRRSLAEAQHRALALSNVQDFDSPVGRGVVGTVDQQRIVSGNARFMDENGIPTQAVEGAAQAQRQRAATVIFVAIDGPARRLRGVADPVKSTTPEAISLRSSELGVRIVMLTGDGPARQRRSSPANSGSTDVEAEVLPEDKAARGARSAARPGAWSRWPATA
jgi:Cu+-exporting ATPase